MGGERWQAYLRWSLVAADHLLLGVSILCAIEIPITIREHLFQMGMAEKLPLFTRLVIMIPWEAVLWVLVGLSLLLLVKEFIITSNRVSIIWNAVQFCGLAFFQILTLVACLLPFLKFQNMGLQG